MAALQRSDFDLIHKTISISKSIEYGGRYIPRVKGTKNAKTRVIPLLAQLEVLLGGLAGNCGAGRLSDRRESPSAAQQD